MINGQTFPVEDSILRWPGCRVSRTRFFDSHYDDNSDAFADGVASRRKRLAPGGWAGYSDTRCQCSRT